ncbi:hypothetical protein OH76DRAFT_264986 [Lentinus brumalis]|uniref:Uncharacterized protein n=1 Tax=Lentinus brumalis TaxID=2498619 RepID=A0A371DGQ3_9APHY|nr:hypothetical protein OH76DRAFT_264986 [Polyporus brumalis]
MREEDGRTRHIVGWRGRFAKTALGGSRVRTSLPVLGEARRLTASGRPPPQGCQARVHSVQEGCQRRRDGQRSRTEQEVLGAERERMGGSQPLYGLPTENKETLFVRGTISYHSERDPKVATRKHGGGERGALWAHCPMHEARRRIGALIVESERCARIPRHMSTSIHEGYMHR